MRRTPEERHLDALAAELREQIVAARRARAGSAEPGPAFEDEVRATVAEQAAVLSDVRRARIERRILRDTVGLGPLEDLLGDDSVEEVMVNGGGEIYIERRGRIDKAPVQIADPGEVRDLIDRILAPLGRRVDEVTPMADARLPDGSRVNVVIPPLAVDGPAISIRRFTAVRPELGELVAAGTLGNGEAQLLREAVAARRGVLISGGTGSGKTTLLNALSEFIGARERVITIEDSAELRLQREHVIRLEARPGSLEGRGEVTIRDLLRNALRMRPDRIVIGEVRGAEAFDLVTALNTGHRGALSTVHANSAADAVRRLQTLALMAGSGLPRSVIGEQIARGIDLIVQLERGPAGTRLVAGIAELVEGPAGPGLRTVTQGAAA